MNDLIIRAFTMDDYDQAYELWTKTPGMGISESDSRSSIEAFLRRNEGLSLVCADGATIAATLLCGHDGRRGFLYHLAVGDSYRRRGIGGELTQRGLHALKEAGIFKCHIFVVKDNELGASFWKDAGWQQRDHIYVFSRDT